MTILNNVKGDVIERLRGHTAMCSKSPEVFPRTSSEASGQFLDTGQQEQVVIVRSASTILPSVDCGVILHPGTEAGRRMLAIRSKDLQPTPSVDIMVDNLF